MKPHITFKYGCWWCEGLGYVFGVSAVSPKGAYNDWKSKQ
jgi:hypothetical protein